MEITSHRSQVKIDVFWYTLGTVLPILISLLRTPVFTRYFTPEEYGNYSLVFITISLFSVFIFTWIASCIWRFYYKFKKYNKLGSFYTNLFVIHIFTSIVFIISISIWISLYHNSLLNHLTIYISIQTIVSQTINYYLIILRLENKSFKYNIYSASRIIISFFVQYYITFQLGMRIEAIPLATLFTELVITAFLIKSASKHIQINFQLISRRILLYIGSFALTGIITNLSTIMLATSDRYIISIFGNKTEVGIYNQIYNFSQLSIMALINIFFAIINPEYLQALEVNPQNIKPRMVIYLKSYIIFVLPVVTFFSIFAKPLTDILFGVDFRSGYNLIPFIVFSMYINGLINFKENKFKYQNKYKIIIIGFIAASFLNILLNIATIPYLGYKMAAVTTLFSYFAMYLFYQYHDNLKLLRVPEIRKIVIHTITILIAEVVFDLIINTIFKLSLYEKIVEFLFFIILYFWFIIKPNYQSIRESLYKIK